MNSAKRWTVTTGRACTALSLLAVQMLAARSADAQPIMVVQQSSPFPLGGEPCTLPFPENTVRLFEHPHFRGDFADLRIDDVPANRLYSLRRAALYGQASSGRWNLPPGVVVMLYESDGLPEDGLGNQYSAWGLGQDADLRDDDFNDEARAWVWHDLGAEAGRHVCSIRCSDHYYDGNRIVYIKGDHRHAPGCGHLWNGTHWVRSPVAVGPPHVCTPACPDHYFDGERLVAIAGHRHGAGCGHEWDGRHWVVATTAIAPGHVCTPNCLNHYFDGSKYIVIKGHRHGPNCGHRWNGRHWVGGR